MRDYDEIDPIILCGESLSSVGHRSGFPHIDDLKPATGDDESEVSIKEAAEAVMKAMDYDGEMVVSFHSGCIKKKIYIAEPIIENCFNRNLNREELLICYG